MRFQVRGPFHPGTKFVVGWGVIYGHINTRVRRQFGGDALDHGGLHRQNIAIHDLTSERMSLRVVLKSTRKRAGRMFKNGDHDPEAKHDGR